ncbi:DUF2971 domain-containing protein [Vibrio alginolyticus]|uniref:DUF2971 domain-containing protein n=2 Tax=Vibrio alginolyticus TaxID=663 RepID=UPI001B8380CB|nr:DUF2971 domain-containing protein [Vibrio alginolyticus]MCG9766115.1 DUF2971 domain-containing protein [Vibrio alginolyticus]HBC3809941.1 DUF2971 domain-containing protein [Vibrio alginolyticus]
MDTNSLSSLANGELWFSSKEDFNDPFEGTLILDESLDESDYELWRANVNWTMKIDPKDNKFVELCEELGLDPNMTDEKLLILQGLRFDLGILTKVVHESKFLCLSQRDQNTDPIYENLMWSHYAQGLRGFCLVFNNDGLQKDINEASNQRMRGIRIIYQDQPNKLSVSEYLRSDMWINGNKKNYIQTVTETIATKSSAWKYENEMRIMTLDSSVNSYGYSPETLEEIVLGDKMPKRHRELVLSIAKSKYPHAKIKTARLIPNTFNIEIVDNVA